MRIESLNGDRYECHTATMNRTVRKETLAIRDAWRPEVHASIDRNRARGALLGLAVGDALGTTLEFRSPGTFEPTCDMVGGGPFKLKPGRWTDDTAMALCLAESLVETGGFDPRDQMERYVRWWREGHWSSTGRCFDIGSTTRAALARFERTGEPYAGSTDPNTAGNGSLMRLSPIAIAYAHEPAKAVRLAGDSSRTTHGALEAVDACRYFASLLVGAMHGVPKNELLSPRYEVVPGLWNEAPLTPTINAVAAGSFRHKAPPEIRGTSHVVRTLEAALWAFATTDDFRSGALAAVNLGDDADTTGAVYGQIAGAAHGATAIPSAWTGAIARAGEIATLADALPTRTGSAGPIRVDPDSRA